MCCNQLVENEHIPEIRLAVEGWPPKKNEATSLFSNRHGDCRNVVELLGRARKTLDESQWNPSEKRPVRLELIVMAEEPDDVPGDVTNYIGGGADVLQANRVNADLSHLEGLAQASFYHDDRQIREVRYFVERGDVPGYRVWAWVL